MSEIHDYDKNRWQGELGNLKEIAELLLSTEMPQSMHDEVGASITELEGFLKYGINEDGTGPDYPADEGCI